MEETTILDFNTCLFAKIKAAKIKNHFQMANPLLAFLKQLESMEQMLKQVGQLKQMVDLETDYNKKMKIYDEMNLHMDEFDKLRVIILQIYKELQAIVTQKKMSEIDLLMSKINL